MEPFQDGVAVPGGAGTRVGVVPSLRGRWEGSFLGVLGVPSTPAQGALSLRGKGKLGREVGTAGWQRSPGPGAVLGGGRPRPPPTGRQEPE